MIPSEEKEEKSPLTDLSTLFSSSEILNPDLNKEVSSNIINKENKEVIGTIKESKKNIFDRRLLWRRYFH